MKKALKITGIVLAAIIVLFVLSCMFTGLVPYMMMKKYMAPLDNITYSEWAHYDAGTLTEYKTVSYDSLYADIPTYMINQLDKDGNWTEFSDHSFISDSSRTDDYVSVMLLRGSTDEIPQITEADAAKGLTQEDLDEFCRSIGKQPIRTRYDYFDLTYSVDPYDINILSKKDTTYRMIFGMCRAILGGSEEKVIYHYENNNVKGFVTVYPSVDGEGTNYYGCIADMYDINDLNTVHTAIIRAPDEETVYLILNSLRIDRSSEQE